MSGTVGNNVGRDSGSVSDSLDATKLTGALPAISGANLTGIATTDRQPHIASGFCRQTVRRRIYRNSRCNSIRPI